MSQNAYVGRLKDGRGDIFYPATKTSVVYDENGVNIEEKVRYFLHPDGAIAYVTAAQIDAHTIDGHDLDWILSQCAVEFDDVPTENSQKAARSGGIWSAIQSVISRIPTALSELTEDANHRTVKDSEKEAWNGKADASAIPTALSNLTDDSTHRTVTDQEKSTWNGKSNFSGNYNDLTNKPSIPGKILWGTVSTSSKNGRGSIVFSEAFSSTPTVVLTVINTVSQEQNYIQTANLTSVNANGFSLIAWSTTSDTWWFSGKPVHWIAIGN